MIDQKIQKIVSKAYLKSLKILQDHKPLIEKMAQLLLNKEYITKSEFLAMMDEPSKIDELIKEFSQDHIALNEKREREKKTGAKIVSKEELNKEVKKFVDDAKK